MQLNICCDKETNIHDSINKHVSTNDYNDCTYHIHYFLHRSHLMIQIG